MKAIRPNVGTQGDAQRETFQIQLRPRLREKDLSAVRWKIDAGN
jgi:hypothetical protein